MPLVDIKNSNTLVDKKPFYKHIGIDLSRQTNAGIPQQFKFVQKLEENYGVKMFFITEK